jgi:hypothetical protein
VVLLVVGDFDCSGEDVERDWVARTGCWSRTERVLLTYNEVIREYELPATEGERGDPWWPVFARCYGFDIERPVQWEVEALEPASTRTSTAPCSRGRRLASMKVPVELHEPCSG